MVPRIRSSKNVLCLTGLVVLLLRVRSWPEEDIADVLFRITNAPIAAPGDRSIQEDGFLSVLGLGGAEL